MATSAVNCNYHALKWCHLQKRLLVRSKRFCSCFTTDVTRCLPQDHLIPSCKYLEDLYDYQLAFILTKRDKVSCFLHGNVCLHKKNKKVLLRERKRHTARHVASTPYVVLTGYPPPARVPPQPGYPPGQGTPPARVPPPPGWTCQGTPPGWTCQGTPPGCPMAFWEMLQSIMGYGYPPPVDRQIDGWMDGWTDACQNITFPSYYVRGR